MAAVWLWSGSFVVSNHLKDHVCMCLRSVWRVIYSKLLCNHMLKSFGLIRVWNELYLWHCDPYSLLNLDLLFMFFCWPVFLRNLYPQKTAGWSAAVHKLTHSRSWSLACFHPSQISFQDVSGRDWRHRGFLLHNCCLLLLYSCVKRCSEHVLSSSQQTWQQLLSLSLPSFSCHVVECLETWPHTRNLHMISHTHTRSLTYKAYQPEL